MREEDLSRILLVQACEQSDPEGLHLGFRERRNASREATSAGSPTGLGRGRATQNAQNWMARRATLLARRLAITHPVFRRACWVARLAVPAPLLVGVALLLGIGLDSLGSLRRIHLLSFPLLALWAWNLGAYGALLVRRFSNTAFRAPTTLSSLAERLAQPTARGLSVRTDARTPDPSSWRNESLKRFFTLWREQTGPLLAARVGRNLHTSAAAMAVGATLSMYLAGFAFEYRATWESTFLDPSDVHALLSFLLAPASAILGLTIPSASEIAALQSPGDGEAAVWIHLWSATTVGLVVVPRAAMATICAARERRELESLSFDCDSPYALHLLAPDRGQGGSVEVLPYSYQPSNRSQELLREVMLELFGNHTHLVFCEPLPYGLNLPTPALPPTGKHCRMIVFNLAQSPEQEVHGALLEEIKEWVRENERHHRILVILDEEPHARRLQGRDEGPRSIQRQRAWERVVHSCNLTACILSTDETIETLLLDASEQIWPSASPGASEVHKAHGEGS
ncbi:DUF2868 domain-containing protein [Myxococcota bacterium]|nr:DUF2868 domain-containing protein [Myxococcota bacterium]